MEKKNSEVNFNLNNTDFGKKYTVIIVADSYAPEGYEFYSTEDEIEKDDKKQCSVTYYYKKMEKIRNPITIIDTIKGDSFKGRARMIAHFESHYALKFSVEQDGFYDLSTTLD